MEEGLRLRDIHYTHDDPEDNVKWILDASQVTFSEDRDRLSFLDFKLRVEPEERPPISVTGERGKYSRTSGIIELWGNLEGTSADGYRILTEYIVIDEKQKELSTDRPVKIFGPFFSVSGKGLLANLESKVLRILSDVTTTIEEKGLTP